MTAICCKGGELVQWSAGRGTRLKDLRCHEHSSALASMHDYRLQWLDDRQRLQVLHALETMPAPQKKACTRCGATLRSPTAKLCAHCRRVWLAGGTL